jgi:uncharacterized protein (TIGR03083 family)
LSPFEVGRDIVSAVKTSDHVQQLQAHGVALADAADRAGLDAAVPTCPDWQVRDLLGHIGRVHRWATSFVGTGRTQPPTGDDEMAETPDDDELLGWFRRGHESLVRTLTETKPDVECWAFLPAPSPLAFWARRQAHETAIHRLDAESATGTVTSFAPEFAVDGIDELLLGFFSRPRGRLVSDPPVSLGLRTTDSEVAEAWTIAIGSGSREVTRGVARGDCIVSGPASELYRLLWNRRDVDDIDVAGDRALLDLWRDKAKVSWS